MCVCVRVCDELVLVVPIGRALGAVLPAGRRQLLLAPAERQPASREDLQLVRDLAFVTRLTNPCQLSVVARARSPPGARQHWQPDQRRAEELAIELHRASTLAAELRQVAVRHPAPPTTCPHTALCLLSTSNPL